MLSIYKFMDSCHDMGFIPNVHRCMYIPWMEQ